MRYPMVAIIIYIVLIAMLIVNAVYPEQATKIFIVTLLSTIAIFHIGFK